MASNFKFLETEFPVLANFGNLAEQYCYTDPNSCLMKLGMIGETIVNLMFTYDKIPVPYDNSAVNRINALFSEGLLTIKYNRVPQAHGSAAGQNRHLGQNLLNLMAKPVDKFC